MSDTPFIKFYPSDFLGGTSGLSPAERGVYITLLCLIYENNGPIAREDSRLSRRCGAPKAAFKKALDALLDEKKISEVDGMLTNNRAEKAIVDRENRTQNSTHAAQKRWTAQKKKSEQNQYQNYASAMPPQCVEDASQKPEPDKEKEIPKGISKKKASRLSEDWVLPSEWFEWALSQGLSADQVYGQAERFRDYWIAKAGKDAAKLDWNATWRNWIRNASKGFGKNERKSSKSAAEIARNAADRFAARRMGGGESAGSDVPLLSARHAGGSKNGGD